MTATAKLELRDTGADVREANRIRALLRLDFSRDSANGNTYLAESLQEPPLKVVRAFTTEDGTALAHLHNLSGGLLGGDHLELQLNLGRGAQVQLTTASATRIYCHREGFSPTTQCNQIAVAEDALLEYLPDATIPFAGARYLQSTVIQLAAGAGLFWWEILAPGREARGEIFAYEQFEVRTRVSALGRRIAAENICLRPACQDIASLARLGNYRYVATFYICRVGRDAGAWRTSEERLRELTTSLTRRGEILWGVSSLVAHGLVVRCLARNCREVLPGLVAIWQDAKRHLYEREAIPPRKVN
ncbi:MAG TPA: urease accessory protein UreD [Candidatus Acidoferrum sp.]|nr:urease accessory protein UreD [Candidatus Acidoferrum sp.]